MQKDIYIHRDIEERIKLLIKQFPSAALTGPRQSGKSTLLKKLFQSTHQFISFDDPLTLEKATEDPKLFLDNIKEPVIFDEIQYAPELLSYLKILIDKDRRKLGRFILTGSQQFNLIKHLGDTLAGRIGLMSLLPFSKHEKSRIFSQRKKAFSPQQYFTDACLRGAFPEISVRQNLDFHDWYGSYVQTYLERDVRSVYDIGNLREFQRFMRLLAARCAQILNLSSIANDLGSSVNTVKKWLSVLEASQLIYLLGPYYKNLGKRITKAPKIYFMDCGLVCYLTGIEDARHLLNGPMAGQIFENYCIQETIKAYSALGNRPDIYYLRTHNDIEIDLIIEKNMRIYPFEIKLTKTPNLNMAKPIERFKKVFSKLDILTGKLICLSEADTVLTKDVSAISIDSYLENLENY